MTTISFTSIKGGVAKSVSALSTAFILSENNKVLLLDMDSNNSATSHFINDIDLIQNRTIRQVLKGECEVEDSIIPVAENLHLIPSEIELSLLEREMTGVSNQVFLLHDALEQIEGSYDYCVIDTPPSIMSLPTKLSIISSDVLVIPTQLEKWGVRAINATFIEIKDCQKVQKYIGKEIERIVILPTFYEENRVVKSAYLNVLSETFPEYLSDVVIHSSTEISKTFAMEGERLSSNTRSYREYRRFVNSLLSKEVQYV